MAVSRFEGAPTEICGLSLLIERGATKQITAILECAKSRGELNEFLVAPEQRYTLQDNNLVYTSQHAALTCAVRMGNVEMVRLILDCYRESSAIPRLASDRILQTLFDVALIQRDSEIALLIWEVAQEIDEKTATDPATKERVDRYLAEWEAPQEIERTARNKLLFQTKILGHAFQRSLGDGVDLLLTLTKDDSQLRTVLARNFQACFSSAEEFLERLKSNVEYDLEDLEGDEGESPAVKQLLEAHDVLVEQLSQLDSSSPAQDTVISAATELLRLAAEYSKLATIMQLKGENDESGSIQQLMTEIGPAQVAKPLMHLGPDGNLLPLNFNDQWLPIEYEDIDLGKRMAQLYAKVIQSSQSAAESSAGDIKRIAADPVSARESHLPTQWPQIEPVLETLASLRWHHSGRGEAWINTLHRLFSTEKNAEFFLHAALKLSFDTLGRDAFIRDPKHCHESNFMMMRETRFPLHVEDRISEGLFSRILNITIPEGPFAATAWEHILIQEPSLLRLLPLADKIEQYRANANLEYPRDVVAFKELILDACLGGLGVDLNRAAANLLRTSIKSGRKNCVTPANECSRAYIIPVSYTGTMEERGNRVRLLRAIVDLGALGDANIIAGGDLFLVSNESDDELFNVAVELSSAMRMENHTEGTVSYFHFTQEPENEMLLIQQNIMLLLLGDNVDQETRSNILASTDRRHNSLKVGEFSVNFYHPFGFKSLLAKFTISDDPNNRTLMSYKGIREFPEFCRRVIAQARGRGRNRAEYSEPESTVVEGVVQADSTALRSK